VIKALNTAGKVLKESKVLILGLTFKENVPDLRNSKAKDLIREFKSYDIEVYGHDPLVPDKFVQDYFKTPNSQLGDLPKVDAVVMFSPHQAFKDLTLAKLRLMMNGSPIVFDLKRWYSKKEAEAAGFVYKHL